MVVIFRQQKMLNLSGHSSHRTVPATVMNGSSVEVICCDTLVQLRDPHGNFKGHKLRFSISSPFDPLDP